MKSGKFDFKSRLLGAPWGDAFSYLARETARGRVVILPDEISWMGSKDPTFLGKLKTAWDIQFKKNDQLILLLCGSASTWIEKNILSSTGFLGRVSQTLTLEELPLQDCAQFWSQNEGHISAYLVLGSRARIRDELALDLNSVVNENPYFQKANKGLAGCQIDLMIQSKFHTLYVCEIRFSAKPIGTGIIKEVEGKIKRLERPKNYSCRPVLIHINGVTQEVADSDYFAAIIDMSQQLMTS